MTSRATEDSDWLMGRRLCACSARAYKTRCSSTRDVTWCLSRGRFCVCDNNFSSSSSMASGRPASAQSRRAWGSMDKVGAVNPAMDDDDLMPAAMESDIYAMKKAQKNAPPPPPPQPTGCWATFTRGVRCTLTVSVFAFHALCFSYNLLLFESKYHLVRTIVPNFHSDNIFNCFPNKKNEKKDLRESYTESTI